MYNLSIYKSSTEYATQYEKKLAQCFYWKLCKIIKKTIHGVSSSI